MKEPQAHMAPNPAPDARRSRCDGAACGQHPPSGLGGFDVMPVDSLVFFSCLEMASDVSSLGAAVGAGSAGPGAPAAAAAVQRASKRRPG